MICKNQFPVSFDGFKNWCGVECGAILGQKKLEAQKAKAAKADRKQDRARKVAMKTRSEWLHDMQAIFNKWVRLRDDELPCIDCGKWNTGEVLRGGKWDAGHYLSRGSHPHLRFDERNVFKQLKSCNMPGGTTAAAFRLGVIDRIGLDAVEALEADQSVKKWTIDDLKEIIAHYRQKIKELKK